VTLAAPLSGRYQIKAVENPGSTEIRNFVGWLDVPLASIQ
jgi:hypothetical protein